MQEWKTGGIMKKRTVYLEIEGSDEITNLYI